MSAYDDFAYSDRMHPIDAAKKVYITMSNCSSVPRKEQGVSLKLWVQLVNELNFWKAGSRSI